MLCQVRRTGVLVRPSFPSASRSLAISAEEISSSSSEGDERVDVEVQDNVAVVTLNRPEKYNALDIDMFRAIAETARCLSQQRELRGVILCGSGKAFCAGLDVKSYTYLDKAGVGGNATLAGLMWWQLGYKERDVFPRYTLAFAIPTDVTLVLVSKAQMTARRSSSVARSQ